MEIIEISAGQLALCLLFVVVAGLCSFSWKLGLERELAVGTLRVFAQLVLMGYVLRYVFRIGSAPLVLAIFGGMILFAVWTIWGRVKEKEVSYFVPVLVSMMLSYMVVSYVVTAVIIRADPWYNPRFFIPLGVFPGGEGQKAGGEGDQNEK